MMLRPTLLTLVLISSYHWLFCCPRAVATDELTYEQHIRPIFRAHCFDCHGATEELEGELDLRQVRLMKQGGSSGPAYSKSRRLVVGESSLSHTRTFVKFRSLWFRPATVCKRCNSLASAANTLLLPQSLRCIGRPGNHSSSRPQSSRSTTCAPNSQS